MDDRRINFSWKASIPIAVITAFLQCVGGAFSVWSSSSETREVSRQITELSHRIEILTVKQEVYEPRFTVIESKLARLEIELQSLKSKK